MVSALICSQADLQQALADTPLWRADVERHVATKPDEAQMMAVAARPRVIVVDAALNWAGRAVARFREDGATRAASIVVLAHGDFDPSEVELLESGANAIVRLPLKPEDSLRLERLMEVPVRKEARFPVSFNVEATIPGAPAPEPAQALNLSQNGMLMQTSAALRIGDALALQFRLPDKEDQVRAGGRVVRL